MKVETPIPAAPARSDSATPSPKGYRQDQGRLARMAGYWSLILLLLFGCSFLHGLLVGLDSMKQRIGDITIPVLGIDLTGAFLVSLGVFAIGAVIIHHWQQQPKVADLLIETEAELRKVTWPSMSQVVNSSIVVVLCVVLIGAFLAAADWFLARLMRYLILGEV